MEIFIFLSLRSCLIFHHQPFSITTSDEAHGTSLSHGRIPLPHQQGDGLHGIQPCRDPHARRTGQRSPVLEIPLSPDFPGHDRRNSLPVPDQAANGQSRLVAPLQPIAYHFRDRLPMRVLYTCAVFAYLPPLFRGCTRRMEEKGKTRRCHCLERNSRISS